jgi:hypothetical protein
LPPVEALRAWILVFIDYIAAKKIIAPALNAMIVAVYIWRSPIVRSSTYELTNVFDESLPHIPEEMDILAVVCMITDGPIAGLELHVSHLAFSCVVEDPGVPAVTIAVLLSLGRCEYEDDWASRRRADATLALPAEAVLDVASLVDLALRKHGRRVSRGLLSEHAKR